MKPLVKMKQQKLKFQLLKINLFQRLLQLLKMLLMKLFQLRKKRKEMKKFQIWLLDPEQVK
jgi:hypothetical protein